MPGDDEAAGSERGRSARPSRRRRIARRIGIALGVVVALAVVAGLVWASTPHPADADGLAAVESDERVSVDERDGLIVVLPTDAAAETLAGQGVVVLAGARVDPRAYVRTFRDVAAEGAAVVIVRSPLTLAILEQRPLSDVTAAVPGIDEWSVAGHSMGGVRACTYAEDDAVDALVLLASYCSLGDLSGRDDLTVLSITGSRDDVLNQEAALDARSLLPDDAAFVELDGVSHAQFGDYGDQPGDGEPAVSDDDAHAAIAAAIVDALRG
ncbi:MULTISPECIES: alpha/beta hydrolase [unclassified Agrococcus]|uniref:alpha/beta hydrolase n=1 Tax=unclassified Agrococcus TaxID=2615065 RepID=UPI00360DA98A